MKPGRQPLPPIGSIVLSRFGRRMRVREHYPELHGVGLVALDDTNCTVHWPREWCICSGDQMPWEYYDFKARGEEALRKCRLKLLETLRMGGNGK